MCDTCVQNQVLLRCKNFNVGHYVYYLFLKNIWARSYDLLTKLLKCDLILCLKMHQLMSQFAGFSVLKKYLDKRIIKRNNYSNIGFIWP